MENFQRSSALPYIKYNCVAKFIDVPAACFMQSDFTQLLRINSYIVCLSELLGHVWKLQVLKFFLFELGLRQ